MPAIVVLGMHRSGTSCLAGMLAAAGLGAAGPAIRNWDNTRGHHEHLPLVRLDEAVLAHGGGHYLTPPTEVAWTAEHAAARDALLATPIAGRPPLLKDPRMLLVLAFWRASTVPWHALGIVRHPLAVARSLAMWRELPLADGIALWLAHNRALAADRARHGYPVIDFDQPRAQMIAAVAAATHADPARLAEGYADELIHHDAGEPPELPGLAEAIALYRELGGTAPRTTRFPRRELATFTRALAAGDPAGAVAAARAALAATADAAAVLVPVVAALIRARAWPEAHALLDAAGPRTDGLVDLLRGKLALARGDAAAALPHLEAACAVVTPLYQAQALLPQALRACGRTAEARTALAAVAGAALYPHGPLATLAEWSALDGDRARALAEMARAIEAAPPRRRGRLRCRRAEWLRDAGDREAARDELRRALVEDPAYPRSRALLEAL